MDRARDQNERFDGEASASASWAVRLRRGEPAAAQEVRARVSRILRHGGLSIPDLEREDLEQEIVTEVWQAVTRQGFDVTGGFWGFVEVVTSRRCIDWLRARRESSPLPDDIRVDRKGPLGTILDNERARLVAEVMTGLAAPCRELISLKLGDNLTYAEIAERSGRSEGALRVQLYRCVRSARKLLRREMRAPRSAGVNRERQ